MLNLERTRGSQVALLLFTVSSSYLQSLTLFFPARIHVSVKPATLPRGGNAGAAGQQTGAIRLSAHLKIDEG